jgi:acetyl esterase/lipase
MPIRSRARTSFFCWAAVVAAGSFLLFTGSATAQEPGAKAIIETGFVYGKGGSEDLKLDLARPEQATGLMPGLVYIHGGGWRGGSRNGYHKEIEEAAQRGYVAVTIDYRLTQPDAQGKAKYPFPAQLEDCKCAVRWLRANADKYHVDPHRIGATGESAGGHLVLLLATTGGNKEFEGTGGNPDVSSQVQTVVNWFGPTDLAKMYGYNKGVDPLLKTLVGGTPEQVPEQYKTTSPVTYVSKETCPILTLHGTADKLVPVDQAAEFDAAMKKAGATSVLVIMKGIGHGFGGKVRRQADDDTFAFFEQHLKHGK